MAAFQWECGHQPWVIDLTNWVHPQCGSCYPIWGFIPQGIRAESLWFHLRNGRTRRL